VVDAALRRRLEDVLAPEAARLRETTGMGLSGWSL
jgi:hypothetical protein